MTQGPGTVLGRAEQYPHNLHTVPRDSVYLFCSIAHMAHNQNRCTSHNLQTKTSLCHRANDDAHLQTLSRLTPSLAHSRAVIPWRYLLSRSKNSQTLQCSPHHEHLPCIWTSSLQRINCHVVASSLCSRPPLCHVTAYPDLE